MLSILQAGIRYSHFPDDHYNPGRQYKQKWQKCQKKKKIKYKKCERSTSDLVMAGKVGNHFRNYEPLIELEKCESLLDERI